MDEMEKFMDALRAEKGKAFACGVLLGASLFALGMAAGQVQDSDPIKPDLVAASERVFVTMMAEYCSAHNLDHAEVGSSMHAYLELGKSKVLEALAVVGHA